MTEFEKNKSAVDTGPDKSVSNEKKEFLETEEYGGPKGLEPTRYGDWEKKGRCIDF
jgi:hypothetical protein